MNEIVSFGYDRRYVHVGTYLNDGPFDKNDFETDSRIKLGTAQVPAPTDLLSRGTGKPLDAKRAKLFHTYTMKGMYACKRGRPHIHTAIAILCTRVRDPNGTNL